MSPMDASKIRIMYPVGEGERTDFAFSNRSERHRWLRKGLPRLQRRKVCRSQSRQEEAFESFQRDDGTARVQRGHEAEASQFGPRQGLVRERGRFLPRHGPSVRREPVRIETSTQRSDAAIGSTTWSTAIGSRFLRTALERCSKGSRKVSASCRLVRF